MPAYRQLYEKLRAAILDGRLRGGVRIPSSRVLAMDLQISRNTVISTYDTLLSEGFLESRRGSGTFVADLPRSAERARRQAGGSKLPSLSARGRLMADQPQFGANHGQITFHPGYPDLRHFPFPVWSRLMTANVRRANQELIGYSMIDGHPELKQAIVEYLAVSRGVQCEPAQIIVVSGTQAALDLTARLLLDPGDHFWIEEPGYQGAYGAFLGAGGRPVPIPIRSDGWAFPSGPAPRLVFVTPSCQWPLTGVMQMDDRLRLLQLASEHDCWIIEDDYDSEYRFRGHAIPAMRGVDGSGRVIYIGTFAKTMFPALRIGFMVVPRALAADFTRAVNMTGQYPSLLLQLTLADFIRTGAFAAHLRRMRSLYAKRKRYFADECRRMLAPWIDLPRSEAGLQMIATLKFECDDQQLLDAALRRSVRFIPLSTLYRHTPPRQGMILGYAASDEAQIRHGLRQLRAVLQDFA
ncbi:MAG: PLP-dependent aminotransferase family protein [Pseudomonadota bacterium]